jgi:FtsZ-interacting cell division protein ZipA
MDAWIWIVIAVAVVAIALVAWVATRHHRTSELRDRFGPEYDRVVHETDDRREAEAELAERRERRDALDIRPLPSAARERYATSWKQVQSRFVDDPSSALQDADLLVVDVMSARGYPVDRFDDRTDTVSVDHPEVIEHYREGHRIARSNEAGGASTEDLRQALIHYRAMFDVLLEDESGSAARAV